MRHGWNFNALIVPLNKRLCEKPAAGTKEHEFLIC
jgi:hypothetical protein